MSEVPGPSGDEPVNLMVATPAYGGLVHTDYAMSLLDLAREGVRFSLVTMGNESLITRARNALLAAFHARRDHVAPVPLKGRGAHGERLFNVGLAVGESGPLALHERVGTAVLLLSRRAVDALVDDARADGRVYERMATLAGDSGTRVHYDVFRVGVVDGEYLSEDYWACDALRRLGFAIHVDPAIVVRHHGTMAA